ncbi:MAG: T9SS C-terminal target domain-containing protein [Bacteroidetes bacterium]|nr:MAG: T9SS C-terminal target domain-containing protein [Bacteroidota bacterium]
MGFPDAFDQKQARFAPVARGLKARCQLDKRVLRAADKFMRHKDPLQLNMEANICNFTCCRIKIPIMNYLFSRTILLLSGMLLSLTLSAQISLVFEVNMSYQIQKGKFNPQTEFVDLAGTFNNWGGTLLKLTDPEGDSVYRVSVSGFTAGQNIAFKFRYNASWGGREEFPGAGNDRTHTVTAGDSLLSYWYNNELPDNLPLSADFRVSDRFLYAGGVVQFSPLTSGTPGTYRWEFAGGLPAVSAEASPQVRYPQAGSYPVRLIVSNATSADTILKINYIEVALRDTAHIPWWNESVFYEVFVRSFYDSDGNGIGDFKGLTQKLDYLNDGNPETDSDLGITGIWLMPIHKSPSYHGYDVNDYRSINPDYGTMADFQAFLTAAHARGIRVIIDYVMNHSSSQHPWFQQSASGPASPYRNFYRWSATQPSQPGPWGQTVWHARNGAYYYGVFYSGMPDLNYTHPPVKDSIFAIADYWLKDIGVDGFRLDAVKYIVEEGSSLEDNAATYQFWKDFRSHYKQTRADAFAVGEAWTSTSTVQNYVNGGGLDYCFEFDLATSMIGAVQGGNTEALRTQMQKVYNVYPHLQFGTFLTNHDQNRIMGELGGDEGKMKAAASLYLLFPGVPYLYYGEEIGMTGIKPDENIRRPMQWSGGQYAGFSTAKPWIDPPATYTSVNLSNQRNNELSLWSHYRNLIHLRQEQMALQKGDYAEVPVNEAAVMAFTRSYRGQSLLLLVNTSATQLNNVTADLSGAPWPAGSYAIDNLLDALPPAPQRIGADLRLSGLSLKPYETKVIALGDTSTLLKATAEEPLRVYPNPFAFVVTIEVYDASLGQLPYTCTDMQGRAVASGSISVSAHRGSIDLSRLTAGVYTLRVGTGSAEVVMKLVKE